jgi:uncharacterized protein (DUF1778 family)
MKSKDQFLQIRVTPNEKAAIKAAAARAGMDMSRWVLNKLFPAAQQTFQELARSLSAADPARRRYVLADLNDFLTHLDPFTLRQAVADAPPAALELYLANYVAAMVETAAGRTDIPPPSWTAAIAALPEPVFGTALPGVRLHLLLRSPPAFRRRNIFIDASVGDRV